MASIPMFPLYPYSPAVYPIPYPYAVPVRLPGPNLYYPQVANSSRVAPPQAVSTGGIAPTVATAPAMPMGALWPQPVNYYNGWSTYAAQQLNNAGVQWGIEAMNRFPWQEVIPSIADMSRIGIRTLQDRLNLKRIFFPESQSTPLAANPITEVLLRNGERLL